MRYGINIQATIQAKRIVKYSPAENPSYENNAEENLLLRTRHKADHGIEQPSISDTS